MPTDLDRVRKALAARTAKAERPKSPARREAPHGRHGLPEGEGTRGTEWTLGNLVTDEPLRGNRPRARRTGAPVGKAPMIDVGSSERAIARTRSTSPSPTVNGRFAHRHNYLKYPIHIEYGCKVWLPACGELARLQEAPV